MFTVQDSVERWAAATYEETPSTMQLARMLDASTPRHQCDVVCDGNTAQRIYNKLFDTFLDVAQARMNADVGVQLKRGDFYELFTFMSDILEDPNFDKKCAKTEVLRRSLNVPPPPT